MAGAWQGSPGSVDFRRAGRAGLDPTHLGSAFAVVTYRDGAGCTPPLPPLLLTLHLFNRLPQLLGCEARLAAVLLDAFGLRLVPRDDRVNLGQDAPRQRRLPAGSIHLDKSYTAACAPTATAAAVVAAGQQPCRQRISLASKGTGAQPLGLSQSM